MNLNSRTVDYVLIIGDFFALFHHLLLVIFIIISFLFKTAFYQLFASNSLNSLNSQTEKNPSGIPNPELGSRKNSKLPSPRQQKMKTLSVPLYDEPPL